MDFSLHLIPAKCHNTHEERSVNLRSYSLQCAPIDHSVLQITKIVPSYILVPHALSSSLSKKHHYYLYSIFLLLYLFYFASAESTTITFLLTHAANLSFTVFICPRLIGTKLSSIIQKSFPSNERTAERCTR